MGMRLQLSMRLECGVCERLRPTEEEARELSINIALFGRVSKAELATQGVCPLCLTKRVAGPYNWTKRQLAKILIYVARGSTEDLDNPT